MRNFKLGPTSFWVGCIRWGCISLAKLYTLIYSLWYIVDSSQELFNERLQIDFHLFRLSYSSFSYRINLFDQEIITVTVTLKEKEHVKYIFVFFSSPSEGLCCGYNCTPHKQTVLCLNETECANRSYCKYPFCTCVHSTLYFISITIPFLTACCPGSSKGGFWMSSNWPLTIKEPVSFKCIID